jgi:hypothetical protein
MLEAIVGWMTWEGLTAAAWVVIGVGVVVVWVRSWRAWNRPRE